MKVKTSKEDFEFSNLPRNRKEVFFDVFKIHWRLIFGIGGLLLLAFLPTLAILFFRDNYCLGLAIKVNSGEVTKETYNSYVKYAHLIASIAVWLSLYIFSIVFSGLMRIYRQLVWLEPLFFKEDFVKGIKDNYKSCAITFTFFGLLLVACKLTNLFTDNVVVQAIPIALSLVIIVPVLTLTLYQSAIYSGGYFMLLKNAPLFYIKDALRVILFTAILYSPLLLGIMNSYLPIKYIVAVVIVLFILPFTLLIYQLFSNYIFDKFINITQYPELVNKGMYKED
ncbi:MAG: hypothetical protein MJ248_01535 [Bacilli bacterium]|nr:hypothetical protein [Bacilli bacterium]